MKTQLFILLANFTLCYSQPILWNRATGGISDDYCNAIAGDDHGNIYLAGSTHTHDDGDVPPTCSGFSEIQNPWVVKLDSSGNLIWSRCFGLNSEFESIKNIGDNQFLLSGWRLDSPYYDMRMRIIDTAGNTTLFSTVSGSSNNANEFGNDACASGYGQYLGVGRSNSITNNGDYDVYLVISDTLTTGHYYFGGSSYDVGQSIIRLRDGNYLITGSTYSNDSDVTFNQGGFDVWILKIDTMANILWQKTYGGTNWDGGYGAVEHVNGDIFITGTTESNDGDVIGHYAGVDGWILKIDSIGNLIWQKCIGGSLTDVINASPIILENTLLIGATTASNDFDVIDNHTLSTRDFWIVYLDTSGNILQSKCYGGSDDEILYDIKYSLNRIIVGGIAASDDGDVSNHHFSAFPDDAWAMVLDTNINLSNSPSIAKSDYFNVYPTVTEGKITIEVTNNASVNTFYSIEIRNLYGELVETNHGKSKKELIDISNFPNGIYLLTVYHSHFCSTYKLIKI